MRTKKSILGFTLVEILIVVVIMAVLAAVVVPQFTGSSDDAKSSTANFNLGAVRSQIQTFRAHHAGVIPGATTGTTLVTSLTQKTKADGTLDASGPYGPYLVEMPENPFTNVATVKEVTAAPTSSTVTADNKGGWHYNKTTGQLWLDSDVAGEFAW